MLIDHLEDLFVSHVLFFGAFIDEASHFIPKVFSFHDSVVCVFVVIWAPLPIENASFLGDGDGCFLDIACDHSDCNSCIFAHSHCHGNFVSQRILDSDHSDYGEVFLVVILILAIGTMLKLFVCYQDSSERLTSEL